MNIAVNEQKPALALSQYVESYWYGQFNVLDNGLFEQRVVPNGCIELIIHLSDDHCALSKSGDAYDRSPPFTLLGVHSRPYTVRFMRRVGVFGLRFFPDGFRNIFGVPPRVFCDTYEDGTDVVGRDFDDFCDAIRAAVADRDRVVLAERLLNELLQKNRRDYDLSGMAMLLIRQKRGLIDFNEIKERVPISLRQLQREFRDQYGMKVSDYIRLSRLNAINKYMMSQRGNLTQLAHEMQFADQSHFIREFKHFTGHAPRRFIRKRQHYIINAV